MQSNPMSLGRHCSHDSCDGSQIPPWCEQLRIRIYTGGCCAADARGIDELRMHMRNQVTTFHPRAQDPGSRPVTYTDPPNNKRSKQFQDNAAKCVGYL